MPQRDPCIETSKGGHIRVSRGRRVENRDRRGRRSLVLTVDKTDMTAGKGWVSTVTPLVDRMEGQRQQSGLGGRYTVRLSPGSQQRSGAKSCSIPQAANIRKSKQRSWEPLPTNPVACPTLKPSLGRS